MIGTAALVLFFSLAGAPGEQFEDRDRDGVDDRLEQQLLERFAPSFRVSPSDCDGTPAEFAPDAGVPIPVLRNGTIYGQVFPVAYPDRPGAHLEVHYYHLWGRDCGRGGHPLDAEHVSVLLNAALPNSPADQWTALYWYAAAHEGTVCNSSNAARSEAIGAEQSGAAVWISEAKHASFLSPEACRGGCGGDDCSRLVPLEVPALINLGEPGAAMHGSVWLESGQWPLREKMDSDFASQLLDQIDAIDGAAVVTVQSPPSAVKAVILGGNSTLGALETGVGETADGLGTAHEKTRGSLKTASVKTGRSLKRAAKAVWRFLGGK